MKNSFLSLKKNLEKKIEENPKKELYFFDESRFGTHSKIGHGWFPKGIRTSVSVKLGFENFYVYSAVSPKTGKDCSLLMPYVNSTCMNVFLEHMEQELDGEEILLVMDGAGWHKSKGLKVPKNIEIIYLPPYSPELNPVERLWLYIKQHTIKNKIYETISLLEDSICDFMKNLKIEQIKQICNYDY
jgi:transposase